MRRLLPALGAVCVLLPARPAYAIRPFVTDDAHVVGKGHVQIETWARRDRLSLQHWAIAALGPSDFAELSLGAVHGGGQLRQHPTQPSYALGGPIAQAKILLREALPNTPPSVGVVVGGIVPTGRGGFEAPGWSGFSYLAVTQAFFKEDDLLIHANVGVSAVSARDLAPVRLTWGVGTQVETIFDVHLIGEIFSGDPYVQGAGAAYQAGLRIIFNDHLQLDTTGGGGLFGSSLMPFFVSSGVRIVSHRLW